MSAIAVPTSKCQSVSSYGRDIDRWIIGAYLAGGHDFWSVVSLLPGVFPTIAREGVERLIAASRVPAHLSVEKRTWGANTESGSEVPGLPTANPLASDWRFTRDTAGDLLERVIDSTGPTQTIALLGAPSVYKLAAMREAPRKFILIDQNRSLALHDSLSPPGNTFCPWDLRKDTNDLPPVQVVLADPPWYEDEALAFLRASARICADQGIVMLGSAPDGVRPGIREERERVIAGAAELGLMFLDIQRLALSYATPFFEHNALRAAGFAHVAPNWRRGDLLIFKRTGDCLPGPVNLTASIAEWVQADVRGATIWVRPGGQSTFVDPTLAPLVPGDILPAVSRRDGRREAADVWTAGNRIYRCDGSRILSMILHAIGVSEAPIDAVQRGLQYSLNHHEATKVEATVAQVERIIQMELQEMRSFANERT